MNAPAQQLIDTARTLGTNTPVTVALLLAVCAGAFAAGTTTSAHAVRIQHVEDTAATNNALIRQQSELITTLAELARIDHERLDRLERE